MSDQNKKAKEFDEKLQEQHRSAKKREEVFQKKIEVDLRRYTFELDSIQKAEAELARGQSTDYGALDEANIAKLRQENRDYILSARNGMEFINKDFRGIMPFFRKNIILVGGKTGEGKSTAVANIVFNVISQSNPKTGKPRRCLVITNEEKSEDVYNRITSLIKGWSYGNHDRITDGMLEEFDRMIPILAENGMLTVIDQDYNGAVGLTTSIEGIKSIFDNLIAKKEYYDVVLIDYWQNIKECKSNLKLNEYETQRNLAALLDNYKNIYPAPIVVMAQVKPPSEKNPEPFEIRIKGSKAITTVATVMVEIVTERKQLRTKWCFHKNRFNEGVGSELMTGFDKGRYVLYDDEFKLKVADRIAKSDGEMLDKIKEITKDRKSKKAQKE